MSVADDRGHRSIGEVLSLLQEEYPDVTISKIRFLESQGLVAPERTASGFRKFYDSDIQRLRWILCKQTDNFLPLKVIKKMLDEGADTSVVGEAESQQTLWPMDEPVDGEQDPAGAVTGPSDVVGGSDTAVTTAQAAGRIDGSDATTSTADPSHPDGDDDGRGARSDRSEGRPSKNRSRRPSPTHPSIVGRSMVGGADIAGATATNAAGQETAASDATDQQPGSADETRSTGTRAGDHAVDTSTQDTEKDPRSIMTPADIVAALQEDPRPGRAHPTRRHTNVDDDQGGPGTPLRPQSQVRQFSVEDLTSSSGRGDFLSGEEVCEMFDIEQSMLDELEKFGLIAPRRYGGSTSYDGSDVEVIAVSVRYATMGVEPRHLRMYKIAAEREAGFVEQLVLPILKQRNPTAKLNAAERSSQLASMGDELHNLILRRHLRNLLDNR